MTARRGRLGFLWTDVGLLAISAGIVLGLFKYNEYRTAKQQAAIRRIEAVGGRVSMDYEYPLLDRLPNWMLRWNFIFSIAGNETREYPNVITLSDVPITDDEFRDVHIEDLQSVTELWVDSTEMTDQSLAVIAKLPRLETLDLNNIKINDANFLHLCPLHSVKTLGLSRITITSERIERLTAQFPNLSRLELADTTITDDALHHLRRLESLDGLYIGDTSITETGLKDLHGLTSLQGLELDGIKSTTIDNVRELMSTLPGCRQIQFMDRSKPCSQCGRAAVRRLGRSNRDLTTDFRCGHVQRDDTPNPQTSE